MNIGITTLTNNVGMGFENIILLLVMVGGFIFYAKDVRIGVMIHFLASSILFIAFYEFGLVYKNSLICVFIFLVLLVFTILATEKSTKTGSSVV